jgi:hypothetical protein
MWVKRGKLSVLQNLFGVSTNNSIGFTATDALVVTLVGTATITTTALYRDPSAWYHIVYSQTTGAAYLYVNNSQVGTSATVSAVFNTAVSHQLGAANTSAYTDGYLAEVNFIDGQALTPSSFGETDATTGQWVAKKYTGTYGNNGFYLDFKDGTSTTTLGYDTAGSNDWTLTNFTRSAGASDCWVKDVPSGNGDGSSTRPSSNYAVLNPLDAASGITISAGNMAVTSGASHRATKGTIALPAGVKTYAECTTLTLTSASVTSAFGICYAGTDNANYNPTGYYGFYASNLGYIYSNGSAIYSSIGTIAASTVLQVASDGTGNYWIGKNNSWYDSSGGTTGNPSTGANPTFVLTGELYVRPEVYNNTHYLNCGQRAFAYTPPTGFKALCTANLPQATIVKGSDHFNTQLSTGANIKTDSEALFTNELEWIKDRANANNHQLIDSVRGSTAVLQSNSTGAETTYSAPSGNSVGWVWRASGSSAVTNTNGSITSTVSANTTAGFSIVTYTGTGANATVGHGLGVAPKMVILKSRAAVTSWPVWHAGIAATEVLYLDLTNAKATSAPTWNSTAPTSTVFSIGTGLSATNTVAYCFAEISGYSKFGKYTGNGNADGPFVYLGFKPKFLMVKNTSTVDTHWNVFDSARSPINGGTNLVALFPNISDSESTSWTIDFTATGFKIRYTGTAINGNGATYIYAAFAESPFASSNAR